MNTIRKRLFITKYKRHKHILNNCDVNFQKLLPFPVRLLLTMCWTDIQAKWFKRNFKKRGITMTGRRNKQADYRHNRIITISEVTTRDRRVTTMGDI